ncbi:MAG: family 10 glycosylhydrolase [Acetivibrionales bacterium]
MKNLLIITALIIILAMFSLTLPVYAVSNTSDENDFRGVWVSTVANIDYPSKPTTDAEVLKNEAVEILNNVRDTGLNAVFLQVRPTADALYKSKYFPWSKYLTGSQGQTPTDNFDPLEFWITEAHKRGIELHAWINPYRVTKKTPTEPDHNFASLYPTNPACKNPGWVVKHTDGNLYFNPGLPEVRKLIIDSVLEIIENYDVDGIHFDDYFYPGRYFNDNSTYEKYGKAYNNIDDWRRANVNTLISDLSKEIKASGKNVRFGISPFGIWANKSSNPLGSDTNGAQSYYDHFADSRKWVKDGMIDYIAPQLYWNIGFNAADYSKLLSWWRDTVRGTGVDLYIGQAAYRTVDADVSSPWYGSSEIEKQMMMNLEAPEVDGSIFFSYRSLKGNPVLRYAIKAFYKNPGSVIPVTVSRPMENMHTSLDKYYINGSSDPRKALLLNGVQVQNRSSHGYFGILVPLALGDNVFTFSQEASQVTRVIHRTSPPTAPQKMSAVEIPASSAFPQSPEYRTEGEKITLSCQAPAGSNVTVRLNGKDYTMSTANTVPTGSETYAATFTYTFTIPDYTGTPRVIDLGKPIYTMEYKGVVKTTTAPANISVIMEKSPFYARVIKEVIDTYNTPSSSDGAAYELYKGMTDYVTGMTDSFIRLSSGQWVRKIDVETYTTNSQLKARIKKVTYKSSNNWDTVSFNISANTAAIASFDGAELKLDVSAVSSAVSPSLPKNSLFSSVSVSKDGNRAVYTFKLKKNMSIEGYYIEKTSTGLTLNIKRPVRVSKGNKPLSGITIMLDPGHGGSEAGAIGPLGLDYAEKDINLDFAVTLQAELEKLGAEILMTRTEDTDLSLQARLAASRNAKPDLFLSLHANSMADNVDISKVDGFSVYYREPFAQPLSQALLDSVTNGLGRSNKGIHARNFYVTRGTWTISILLENGFVPNPDEFEWLTDEYEQSRLAENISQTIAEYFSK